jgi:hypothetical protein
MIAVSKWSTTMEDEILACQKSEKETVRYIPPILSQFNISM